MKKGFTLVELLAVIAILAILVIIAVPNVIELFKEAKKNTFLTEVKKIYTGAEQEYINDSFSSTSKIKTYSKCSSGCSNGLSMNTRKELEYYVEMHNGKIIKLFVKDSDYQYSYVGELDLNDIKDVEEIALTDEVITIGSTGADYVDQNIEAKFITGPELNVKMKKLAGDDTSSNGYNTINTSITAIKRFTGTPSASNMQSNNLVSVENSNKPIYMWYEDGTIYWYTEAQKPSLNRDSSNVFKYITNLSDINSLSDFNVSQVRNFERTFYGCSSITSLEPIRNWDTKRATNMFAMFAGKDNAEIHIMSLEPLKNWNTSNVTNMRAMFQKNVDLVTLEGLENWNTSKVTTLRNIFYENRSLTSISALKNWNTSKVTDMRFTFYMNQSLTTLNGLENWDTSKVIDMMGTFHGCNKLQDATAIENWDVSNVQLMTNMFNISDIMTPKYSSLKKLDLSKWNMINVESYRYWVESLTLVSMEVTIRSTKVTDYTGMFQDTSNYCSDANHTTYNCQIVVNYTNETEELVDNMIATKSRYSNVVKGRLVE